MGKHYRGLRTSILWIRGLVDLVRSGILGKVNQMSLRLVSSMNCNLLRTGVVTVYLFLLLFCLSSNDQVAHLFEYP